MRRTLSLSCGCLGPVAGAAETTAREIDLAVRELVEAAVKRAGEILKRRRSDLEAGVTLLIQRETLTAEEFEPLCPSGASSAGQAGGLKGQLPRITRRVSECPSGRTQNRSVLLARGAVAAPQAVGG